VDCAEAGLGPFQACVDGVLQRVHADDEEQDLAFSRPRWAARSDRDAGPAATFDRPDAVGEAGAAKLVGHFGVVTASLDGRRAHGQEGRTRPFVCVGCRSQSRIWHDLGNCSYVSGLLIGARAVALMGLHTRLGLISGKVLADHKGRQTLGRISSVPCCPLRRELLGDRGRRQIASMAASFGASNRVPYRRRLQDRYTPQKIFESYTLIRIINLYTP
jgi:hypothetical protein